MYDRHLATDMKRQRTLMGARPFLFFVRRRSCEAVQIML